jgi:hypothetical protein
MLENFELRTAEDESDEKLLADIEKYGWHILGILAEGEEPEYSFTVGLYYQFSHPEILIMGLPANTAKKIINTIGALVKDGATFESGQVYSEIIESFSVAFTLVDTRYYKEYLGYGVWFYRSLPKPFPTLQLVWPDKAGLFPWQQGYDQRYKHLQRLLNAAT